MTEEWKQITEYPNYSISNLGNVRNKSGKSLKGGYYNGYKCVCLIKDKIRKDALISRLVGEYFLEGFNPNLEIDHIDRNKQNNNVSNLRCVSRSENMRNRNKFGGCSSNYKGVSFENRKCKWRAQVRTNGKKKHLGYFETEEEASKKYLDWNAKNGFII